jgi:hypothetical protein
MAWCSTFVRVTHQNVVSITDTHVIPPFFRLLLLALYNDRASAAAAQNRTSRRRLQPYMIWDHPCPEKHSGVAIDACRNNTGPSGISVGSGGIERHSGRPPAGTALGVGGLLGERNRSNSFDCNAFVAPRCLNAAETSEPNDRTFAAPSPTRNPEGSRFEIDLVGTSVAFQRGHRMRVHVTSSHFPQFDRHPNTGGTFGTADKVQVATQTIYHDAERPSHILLPVIPPRHK